MRTLKEWAANAPRDYSKMPGLERLAVLEAELSAQRERLLVQESEAAAHCQAQVAQELARARAEWVDAEAQTLAQLIRHEVTALEGRLATAVEAVLAPFLDGEVKTRAMAEFSNLIRRQLAEGGNLVVKGSADMLASLRMVLGEDAKMVSFNEGPGSELTAQAGPTQFATQLEDWRDRLSGGES